jgi:hypothetical protein
VGTTKPDWKTGGEDDDEDDYEGARVPLTPALSPAEVPLPKGEREEGGAYGVRVRSVIWTVTGFGGGAVRTPRPTNFKAYEHE